MISLLLVPFVAGGLTVAWTIGATSLVCGGRGEHLGGLDPRGG
jgi:hypothetical protein